MTSSKTIDSKHRISSLDGLRAASITLVLLGHISRMQGDTTAARVLDIYANFGVRVFFVISGFLITTLLLNEAKTKGVIDLKAFYLRRCFRIFPAAYAFIIISFALWGRQVSPIHVATAFTYTVNYDLSRPWLFGHLWSLGVEEQFYLLWPALLVLFFAGRKAILIGTIAVTPVLNIALLHYGFRGGSGLYFWTVSDALATGCLLAAARPNSAGYRKFIESRWFLLVTAFIVCLPEAFRHIHGLATAGGLTLCHVGIALTIDHCIRRRYAILNNRFIVWIGVLSYSLYLWQQPFTDSTTKSLFTIFPINIVCAFAFAVASYYLVERPMLRLGAKLTRKTLGKPRAAMALAEL